MQQNSKKIISHVVVILKGLWIGGTMTIPGVSGGSMALLLGVYDDLIAAIASFRKNWKHNLIFLCEFVLGGLGGLAMFSGLFLKLLEKYPMPTSYFFLGAVAAGIPVIFKEAGIRKFTYKIPLCIPIGIGLVLLLGLLPEGAFSVTSGGIASMLMNFAGGIIIAVALVLPGISVSQMLLMMGLYETVFGAMQNFNILPLIPMGIGLVVGILLTTSLLGKALEKYPQVTYLVVFGFVLGSLPQLFPGIPSGGELILCIVTMLAGFALIFGLMLGNQRLEKASS